MKHLRLNLIFIILFSFYSVFGSTGEIILNPEFSDLKDPLHESSSLCTSIFGGGPGSLKGLKRKAKADVKSITKKLFSLGYFDAKTEFAINKIFPFTVKFTVHPGIRFKTTAFQFSDKNNQNHKDIFDEISLEAFPQEAVFSFYDYEVARKKMLKILQRKGFASAEIELPELKIDYDTKKVTAVFPIFLGKIYTFGDYVIEGKPEDLDVKFLERRFFWKKDEIFNIDLLDASKEEILDLQIFSIVSIDKTPEKDQQKIKINLKKNKPRTASLLLRYFSNEGFGGVASLKHRDLFGNAEQFDVTLKYSTIEKSMIGTFLKPDIFDVLNQKLFLQFGLLYLTQSSYETGFFKTTLGIKSKWSKNISSSVLLSFEKKNEQKSLFPNNSLPVWSNLLYAPVELKWDTRDSTSNPKKGWLSSITLAPYFPVHSNSASMQMEFAQTAYLSFSDLTYGLSFKIGTFLNTSLDVLPIHKQYLGGGDGSVRGYAPALLSSGIIGILPNTDTNSTNTTWAPYHGTLSKIEFTQELRGKINSWMGWVGFLDMGVFSNNANPFVDIELMKERDFEKQVAPLSVGFGVGMSFETPVGPIRFDIALPMTRRHVGDKVVDGSFQFYLRFGQGF